MHETYLPHSSCPSVFSSRSLSGVLSCHLLSSSSYTAVVDGWTWSSARSPDRVVFSRPSLVGGRRSALSRLLVKDDDVRIAGVSNAPPSAPRRPARSFSGRNQLVGGFCAPTFVVCVNARVVGCSPPPSSLLRRSCGGPNIPSVLLGLGERVRTCCSGRGSPACMPCMRYRRCRRRRRFRIE